MSGAAVVVAAAATGGALAATPPASSGATASAKALAVRIVFPTGRVVGSELAAAGTTGSAASQSYVYPADGSVIVTGDTKARAVTKHREHRDRELDELGFEHLALRR